MEVSSRDAGKSTIIDVSGEVDLYSSPKLRKEIIKFTKKKTSNIFINLNDVGYMDSSGIATLVEGLQLSNKYKGGFKLIGLSAAVKEVFALARLEKVFEIYDEEKDALDTVGS